MIPIKEVISSCAWLHCEINESTIFRLKVLSFQKINLLEVDNPERIVLKDEGTIIWIMELEVVNVTKKPISTVEVGQLVLVDQDGFIFYAFRDDHLRCYSAYAKKKKLERFFGEDLIPKIKATGAILFQLPDDDEAVYSISMKDGSIREV